MHSGNWMSHCNNATHKDAAQRFRKWEAMFAEENTIAKRVPDPAGVYGFSVFSVQCAVCPSRSKLPLASTEGSKLVIGGNQTRYSTKLFNKHCNSSVHCTLCEQQDHFNTVPQALQQVASGPIGAFFSPRGFTLDRSTFTGGESSHAGSSSAALVTSGGAAAMDVAPEQHTVASPMQHATAPQNTLPCTGLVSGPQYYALAICFSTKATAKIGKTVATDAVVEYVCEPDRVAMTAVVHHHECCVSNKCDQARKSYRDFIAAIEQRAERARLTLAKIDCLDAGSR